MNLWKLDEFRNVNLPQYPQDFAQYFWQNFSCTRQSSIENVLHSANSSAQPVNVKIWFSLHYFIVSLRMRFSARKKYRLCIRTYVRSMSTSFFVVILLTILLSLNKVSIYVRSHRPRFASSVFSFTDPCVLVTVTWQLARLLGFWEKW